MVTVKAIIYHELTEFCWVRSGEVTLTQSKPCAVQVAQTHIIPQTKGHTKSPSHNLRRPHTHNPLPTSWSITISHIYTRTEVVTLGITAISGAQHHSHRPPTPTTRDAAHSRTITHLPPGHPIPTAQSPALYIPKHNGAVVQLQSYTQPENTNSHKHLTPSPTVITTYTQQHTPRRHKVTITISQSHLYSARPGHERTGRVSPHRTQKPELFTLNSSLARVCSNLTKPHRTPEAPQPPTPRSQWSRHLIKMPRATQRQPAESSGTCSPEDNGPPDSSQRGNWACAYRPLPGTKRNQPQGHSVKRLAGGADRPASDALSTRALQLGSRPNAQAQSSCPRQK